MRRLTFCLDDRLWRRCLAGEPAAQEEVCGCCCWLAGRLCGRYGFHPQEAEDLGPGFYLHLTEPPRRRLADYPGGDFLRWLTRRARGYLRDHARARTRHPVDLVDPDAAVLVDVAAAVNVEEEVVEQLEREMAWELALRVVAVLPREEQRLFDLREVRHCSYQEVAAILECTPAAARKKHERLGRKIRQRADALRGEE